MFRDVARKDRSLPAEECIEILKSAKRGVLSVIGDNGYPYGMPLNHYYDEEDGKIYFHCGKTGHRKDSLEKCRKVSFCVYDEGRKTDGWALEFRSVVVFGTVSFIDDSEKALDICRRLSLKFTDDISYIENEINAFADKVCVFSITPEHVTGKKLREA